MTRSTTRSRRPRVSFTTRVVFHRPIGTVCSDDLNLLKETRLSGANLAADVFREDLFSTMFPSSSPGPLSAHDLISQDKVATPVSCVDGLDRPHPVISVVSAHRAPFPDCPGSACGLTHRG